MTTKALFIFLCTLLAYSSASLSSILQQGCFYTVSDGAIYSLYGFNIVSFNVPNINIEGTPLSNVTLDLCQPDIPACPNTANGDMIAIINDNSVNPPECANLAEYTDAEVSYYQSGSPDSGVSIVFPSVTNTLNTSQQIQLVVNVLCNSSVSTSDIQWQGSYSNNVFTLQGSGAGGCPAITLAEYLVFFEKYQIIFTIVFIVVGLFALIAGLKFFNITIFVFTTIIVAGGLFVIILLITGLNTSVAVQWVVFAICCIIGLGCGYLSVRYERLGFFALGALLGGVGAFFLYGLLFHFFGLAEWVLYVIVVIIALIVGGLSLWLWKNIIIFATSCIGSYLVIRGISFYAGGFPSEMSVINGVEEYDYKDYIYLAFMVIVAIMGMVYQTMKKRRDEANEKEINSGIDLSESIARY